MKAQHRGHWGVSLVLGVAWGTYIAAASQEEPGAVTRVVGLLESLKSRIEKDGEAEQKVYDKYACWCESTTKKTADTITEVRKTLTATGTTILRLKGSVATLSSEISGLAEDIKKNEDQQAEATSIREKESASYMAEKVETESAIGALEKAITVLSAATTKSASALLQTSRWKIALSDAVSAMQQASVQTKLNSKQLATLSTLTSNSYAPQSATIQGILGDMYTTFSKNLETSTHDEATAHRNFEDLMATYQKQMITLQETLVAKEKTKSENELQLADATQQYADSEEQLKAEIELFDATKKSCTEKTEDWSTRSSLRTAELEGISKALEILTSDEAKELFAKSIKPGFSKGGFFLQLASSNNHQKQALEALQSHARKSNSLRLAALAAKLHAAKVGHFDAVIKAIDNMLVQLQEEEAADIKKVDECKEQYQDITLSKNDLNWKIENNDAKIQKHEKEVKKKTEAKDVTIKDIESADKMLKDMKDKRKEENDKYIASKEDDEKAIELLTQAKEKLEEYFKSEAYKKGFLQQSAEPEPDFKLSKKDSAKGQTDGVVSLLAMIIEDLEGELKEEKKAEEAAQLDYESLKKTVEDQKDKLTKMKINLEDQIAEENTAKDAEEDLKTDNEDSLKGEETTEADLKKTCDDAIKLQPSRAEKRSVEAEGLKTAKEFLAGMSPDALVQTESRSQSSAFPSFQTLNFLQRQADAKPHRA